MADNKQIKEVVVVAGGGAEVIDVASSVNDYRTYAATAITLAAAFNKLLQELQLEVWS